MEVAPFFVDFHHFLSIFTIFYRFSRFTHFCRNLHFVATYALFPQNFFGQNSLLRNITRFLHVCVELIFVFSIFPPMTNLVLLQKIILQRTILGFWGEILHLPSPSEKIYYFQCPILMKIIIFKFWNKSFFLLQMVSNIFLVHFNLRMHCLRFQLNFRSVSRARHQNRLVLSLLV